MRAFVQIIMRSDYVNVTRTKVCPACGEENRIRYDYRTMVIEAPCSSCGALVKWKRKMPGSGGKIRTAFEDDGAEIVPPDHNREGDKC